MDSKPLETLSGRVDAAGSAAGRTSARCFSPRGLRWLIGGGVKSGLMLPCLLRDFGTDLRDVDQLETLLPASRWRPRGDASLHISVKFAESV